MVVGRRLRCKISPQGFTSISKRPPSCRHIRMGDHDDDAWRGAAIARSNYATLTSYSTAQCTAWNRWKTRFIAIRNDGVRICGGRRGQTTPERDRWPPAPVVTSPCAREVRALPTREEVVPPTRSAFAVTRPRGSPPPSENAVVDGQRHGRKSAAQAGAPETGRHRARRHQHRRNQQRRRPRARHRLKIQRAQRVHAAQRRRRRRRHRRRRARRRSGGARRCGSASKRPTVREALSCGASTATGRTARATRREKRASVGIAFTFVLLCVIVTVNASGHLADKKGPENAGALLLHGVRPVLPELHRRRRAVRGALTTKVADGCTSTAGREGESPGCAPPGVRRINFSLAALLFPGVLPRTSGTSPVPGYHGTISGRTEQRLPHTRPRDPYPATLRGYPPRLLLLLPPDTVVVRHHLVPLRLVVALVVALAVDVLAAEPIPAPVFHLREHGDAPHVAVVPLDEGFPAPRARARLFSARRSRAA